MHRILLLGAFQSPKRKKTSGICNLPRPERDLRDGGCQLPLPCAIWPAKGLDLGLLDPASALQKTPSSAAHALRLFG